MFARMREDIAAARGNDPAAPSVLTVLVCYSGVHAIWAHRWNHFVWNHGFKFLSRWGSQIARAMTGVEIHPAAQIGRRFFIDHGMGVVIGETTIIGDDVVLYQGVTLGGTGKETGKRHPTIEDGAVVGVGASVLGNITIGKNSKVGGGAVVVDDVPSGCTVVGIPGHIVKCNGERVKPSKTSSLRHENLPDPIVDALEELQKRIDCLEQRVVTLTETPGTSHTDDGEEAATGDKPE